MPDRPSQTGAPHGPHCTCRPGSGYVTCGLTRVVLSSVCQQNLSHRWDTLLPLGSVCSQGSRSALPPAGRRTTTELHSPQVCRPRVGNHIAARALFRLAAPRENPLCLLWLLVAPGVSQFMSVQPLPPSSRLPSLSSKCPSLVSHEDAGHWTQGPCKPNCVCKDPIPTRHRQGHWSLGLKHISLRDTLQPTAGG